MMQARNRFVGYSAPIKSWQRFSADGVHHLLFIITTDITFRQSCNKNMAGAQLYISLRDLHLATQTTADTLAWCRRNGLLPVAVECDACRVNGNGNGNAVMTEQKPYTRAVDGII